ncbi:hypothetical protein DAEQUDRAFT_462182 [Daedalea quercina L-15889]|uniref:Uncharacterized protein n=1 Tax=Daedalea quercina L-15889 TaxID=1314783 RepID=A0A165TDI1_9APHY|nr:hypothetical protein DAEQUDRAFT_462182 [Daedalea quercina L-15889]
MLRRSRPIMTITLTRLKDNLNDLPPPQRTCLVCLATITAVVVFPFVLIYNIIYIVLQKIGLIAQAGHPGVVDEPDLSHEQRRGSIDSTTSAPPSYHSKEASPTLEYSCPPSPSETRQLKRARLFIDGSVRHDSLYRPPTPALVTSYSDYATYYVPAIASSPSTPRSLTPLRRLLPSLHRRAMSDSDAAAMSIISSQSAPCSLSSGGYYSSNSSDCSSPLRRQRRRASSQASLVDEFGVVRMPDARPVNAMPGEIFQQRFGPFRFRRAPSPTTDQPVSPKTRSFSPTARLSRVEEKPECRAAKEVDGDRAQEHDTRRRLGGLRELGKKIRRRVVARRRNTAEMDPYGAGSY